MGILTGALTACGGEDPDLPALADTASLDEITSHAGGAFPDSVAVAEEVKEMLRASAGSWNAGDLEGFLDDYLRSPFLTFSGSGGVTRGWEDVRERYQESYWAPGASRDSLRFENLEVTPLGDEHALALGRFVLFRAGGAAAGDTVTSSGFFSLVLARTGEGWRIVHDHTSSREVR